MADDIDAFLAGGGPAVAEKSKDDIDAFLSKAPAPTQERVVRPTDYSPEEYAEAESLLKDASDPYLSPMETRGDRPADPSEPPGTPYNQARFDKKNKARQRVIGLTGNDAPGSDELARRIYAEKAGKVREKSDNPMESSGVVGRMAKGAYNTTRAAAATVIHGVSAPFVSERTNLLRANEFEKVKKDVGAAFFGAPESGTSMADVMTPPKMRLDPSHYSKVGRDLPAGLTLAQGAGDVAAEALPIAASLTSLDPMNAAFEGVVAAARAGKSIYDAAKTMKGLRAAGAKWDPAKGVLVAVNPDNPEHKALVLAFDTYEEARVAGNAAEMKKAADEIESLHASAVAEDAARAERLPGGATSKKDFELHEALKQEEVARLARQNLPGGVGTAPQERRAEFAARMAGGNQARAVGAQPVLPPVPNPIIGSTVIVGGKGDGIIKAIRKVPGGPNAFRVDFPDGSFMWSDEGKGIIRGGPGKKTGGIIREGPPKVDSDAVAAQAISDMTPPQGAIEGVSTPPAASGAPGALPSPKPKVPKTFREFVESKGRKWPVRPSDPDSSALKAEFDKLKGEAGFAHTGILARGVAGAYGGAVGSGMGDSGESFPITPEVNLPFGIRIPSLRIPEKAAYGAAGALLGAGAVGAAIRAGTTSGGILKRTSAALSVVEEGKAFGDAILKTLPDAAKAGWRKVVPPGQSATLAKLAKTDAELAHSAVAQAVDDSLAEASRGAVYSYQHEKDMDIAFRGAGILPGTPQRQAVQLYMDGTHAAPGWLTGDARRAADAGKQYHQDLLDRAVAARVTSPETREAYRGGFSNRKFATQPAKKPSGFAGSKHGVDETFYKQDAEGLVVGSATVPEVEAAIQRVSPGWKNFRDPTHEGGTVLVKVGRGPQAERITDALEATFGSRVKERIREMPMSERLARGELMDPVERFHATSRSLESRVIAGEFLADVEKATAWHGTGTPPPGYLMVPDDGAYGMLRGQFVPEKVHAFVTEKVGTIDEAYRAIDGVMSAMREAYIATPRGVGQNFLTNFLQYSTFTDVHPVFNVDGIYQWGRAAKDMATFRKTGKLSPTLQAFVDAGGDLRNITEEIADELDRVAVGIQALEKDKSAFNRAKGWTELVGGSPHFKTGRGGVIDTAVNATSGAVRGGVKGLLRGENPIRGAIEGAAHMGGMTQVAKASKSLFGFMDPWYQVTAFGKQYEMALARGMNTKDAAKYAMGEVAKYSQEFRTAKLAKSFNLFTGRAPVAGRQAGNAAQQMTKALVPSFLTFPYNQVRIFSKGFQEKPLSATLALMQGKWARRAAIGEMMRRGIWSKEKSDKFDRQHPNDLPALVDDGRGGKKVILWDQSRQWPGAEVLMPGLAGAPGGIPMGILPGAIARTGQAVAGALSGDTSSKEVTSGFPVFQPDEAQQPGAGVLRQMEQGFGGPLSPQGSYRQNIDRAVAGKEDLGGQAPNLMNVAIGLLTGVRLKDYDRRSEDKRAKGIFKIEKGNAQKQKSREVRSPMNTPEEKKAAKGIFKRTRKELKAERDEKIKGPK